MRQTGVVVATVVAFFFVFAATVWAGGPTELVPPREIHVRVVETPGTSLPGVTVSVLDVNEKEISVKIADADGRVIFTSLPEGNYYVRFQLSGFLTQTLGPVPVGKPCVRLPELRVVLLYSVSTCY